MKHLIFLILFITATLSCQKKITESKNTVELNHVSSNQFKNNALANTSDTIHVNISKDIFLIWDKNQNALIKNQDYYNILKDRKEILMMTQFIANNDDLDISICSKTGGNLKKGDIAFIYLYENQKVPAFKCFNIQFDFIQNNCKMPEGLLNYIEKYRNNVVQKILKCLDN